ncbi:MAG TPA: PQQ-binding-like beta-propeller repeat protein [Planctomycetaceae bacterium]|nr:PQQ-binding-like beta-propeller repeat protein [Planctomycetaceae bacterium]
MPNGSTSALFLLCLVAAIPARAEDWRQFRGPTGQGHAKSTNLPIAWSPDKNVVWRSEIPGRGWSSPILLGRRIYLTTAVPKETGDAPAQSLRALSLDAASGQVEWDVEVFEQPAGVGIHGKNSHASATPITDGNRIYVHFGTHGTAALDLSGAVLWRNSELKYDPRHGNGGSPELVDDTLVVSCDGLDVQFVVALDRATGKIRWKTPRNTTSDKGFSFSTPLVIDVGGVRQIVSAGSDAVIAYAPDDGREIWRVTYPGGFSVVPRPVYGQGLLFVCSGYNAPNLLAIRPDGAAGDVTATHVAWRVSKGVPNNPSPLLVDDAIYLIADNGIATCIEAKTGKQRWQKRVKGAFSASPLYADRKIFLQNEEGEGVVLAADSRAFVELGFNSLGEKSLASYAAGDESLFIRSERHLWRIQAK